MNTRPYRREQVLDRLRQTLRDRRPIVGAGCSSGLITRAAVAAGADLIFVYNTGRSRLMGLRTTGRLNHPNPTTMRMHAEIANVAGEVPIVGGADARDPSYSNLDRLAEAWLTTGFDGLVNFPSANINDDATKSLINQGLSRDSDLVRAARERNLFTAVYSYTEDHTRSLVEAGADVVVPHAGWTTGGQLGAGSNARSLDESCEHVQRLIEAAREVNPRIIALAHGGAIATAVETEYLYAHTDAQGFVGASSIERIPVEQAIVSAVKDYKAISLRNRGEGEGEANG